MYCITKVNDNHDANVNIMIFMSCSVQLKGRVSYPSLLKLIENPRVGTILPTAEAFTMLFI